MNKIRYIILGCLLIVVGISFGHPSASVKYATIREEDPNTEGASLVLPYFFPSDSMGTVFGAVAMRRGYLQEQMGVFGTLYGSADETRGGVFSVWDFRVPGLERMYLSAIGSMGHYPRQRAYANYPGGFNGVKAGSNDSSIDDYVEDSGQNNWLNLKMEYVLPIGSAINDPVMTYRLHHGILVSEPSGGGQWNPLETGVTVLMLQQRFTYQKYETQQGEIDGDVQPIDIGLLYNNTDYAPNPSRGSSQYFSYTHDFSGGVNGDWDFVSFEASKYFELPTIPSALQQVIALNFWTGFSPSWEEHTDASGETTLRHTPPFLEGANLGGFYRLRGYSNHRFNDRAVIYSTAEYRHTLRWNPLRSISWLSFLQPDWLQLVASVEGGQVAGDVGVSDLFDSWKVCGGIGIRAMFSGTVFRFDISKSDEMTNAWAMVGHPF